LQLNVFEPLIGFNLFQSIDMLSNAVDIFMAKCLTGITANADRCLEMVRHSMGLATALAPVLGYDEAARIAKESGRTGRSVHDLVLEQGLLTEEEMESLLDPRQMTQPRAMAPRK
jgi:aspartate ammonia-lyase